MFAKVNNKKENSKSDYENTRIESKGDGREDSF